MEPEEEMRKDVETLVQKLMDKEGVERYELFFEGKSEAGDNYAGEIFFLKVVPEDDKAPYNLVLKTAKREKGLSKWMPVDLIYDRELFMYDKVFPTFRKLIEETGSELLFNFVPKVYSISHETSKQTIIFENLKTRGFKLYDRKKPWTLEHSLMAMRSYGEFHALSLALRDQKPKEYFALAEQMPCVIKEFNKNLDINNYLAPSLNSIFGLLGKMGRDDLVKKYDSLIHECEHIMNHEAEEEGDKLVIGHVDCWNNNFMFQYQDNDENQPKSICLLDFQLSLPCSPVIDLSYNIYTTCDKYVLENFDLLLQTYHKSLTQALEGLGSKADIFTFEQLKEHWRKYAKFGIITALLVLKICLVDKENVPDFTEISKKAENMEEFAEALNVSVKTHEEEYNRRNLDVFVHFGENFL